MNRPNPARRSEALLRDVLNAPETYVVVRVVGIVVVPVRRPRVVRVIVPRPTANNAN